MATTQPLVQSDLDPAHWLTPYVTFAMNGAVPGYDSASKAAVTVSAGGSGYSIRTITGGTSLWTPNGGWARFAVGQDWSGGARSVIALCRVNGADNPWGGLFAKLSSGTSSQFGAGRRNFDDAVYGAVNDTTQLIPASTISSLSGVSVLVLTHNGLSTSGISFYLNGTLVGTTAAAGAPLSGTGNLILGASRDLSATFDSDVDWLAFIHVNKVPTSTEITTISSNVWAMWLDGTAPPAAGLGFVRISGSWKNLSGVYVRVAGAWKSGQFSPNVSGSWKTLA